MAWVSTFTDERLQSLYDSPSFGGETTMRAKVIRELIDELRELRRQVTQQAGMRAPPQTTPN